MYVLLRSYDRCHNIWIHCRKLNICSSHFVSLCKLQVEFKELYVPTHISGYGDKWSFFYEAEQWLRQDAWLGAAVAWKKGAS